MKRLNKSEIEIDRTTPEDIINTFVSVFEITRDEITGIENIPGDEDHVKLVTTSGDYFLLRYTNQCPLKHAFIPATPSEVLEVNILACKSHDSAGMCASIPDGIEPPFIMPSRRI